MSQPGSRSKESIPKLEELGKVTQTDVIIGRTIPTEMTLTNTNATKEASLRGAERRSNPLNLWRLLRYARNDMQQNLLRLYWLKLIVLKTEEDALTIRHKPVPIDKWPIKP